MAIEFKRDEDFFSGYANNVYLEATTWDLKLYFGQADLALGSNVVVQHTAITMPWQYAKLLIYLLQTQVAGKEAEDGHIPVPKNMLAVPPEEPSKEALENLKHAKEGLDAVRKIWEQFLAANPEAKP